MIHQPISVVSQCSLNAWLKELASRDQRRLMGSGITLQACSRRCAAQIQSLLYLLMTQGLVGQEPGLVKSKRKTRTSGQGQRPSETHAQKPLFTTPADKLRKLLNPKGQEQ